MDCCKKKVVRNVIHLINPSLRKYAYFQRSKVVHARNLKEKVDQSRDSLLMISSKFFYLRPHNIIPYDVFEQIFDVTELGKRPYLHWFLKIR